MDIVVFMISKRLVVKKKLINFKNEVNFTAFRNVAPSTVPFKLFPPDTIVDYNFLNYIYEA